MRWRIVPQVAALLALMLILLVSGPLRAQQEGDPVNGAALYAANCAVCHGPKGEGRVGATLSDVFGGIAPDEFLKETISQGRSGTFMPAWSQAYGGPLTDEEIADIIAYIESWGTTVEPPAPAPPRPPQEIPPVPQVSGDPNAGYTIFQTNCVACHGEQGQGRIGATLTTTFAAIEPGALVIETVSRGVAGSLMPPFAQAYGGPLTEQEINDVAAYVLSLQRAVTPSPGEVVGRGSAWPLAIVGMLIVVVIVALGVAAARRERAGG